MCVCVCVCVCVYVCVCVCELVCRCVCECVCARAPLHVCRQTSANRQTHSYDNACVFDAHIPNPRTLTLSRPPQVEGELGRMEMSANTKQDLMKHDSDVAGSLMVLLGEDWNFINDPGGAEGILSPDGKSETLTPRSMESTVSADSISMGQRPAQLHGMCRSVSASVAPGVCVRMRLRESVCSWLRCRWV